MILLLLWARGCLLLRLTDSFNALLLALTLLKKFRLAFLDPASESLFAVTIAKFVSKVSQINFTYLRFDAGEVSLALDFK